MADVLEFAIHLTDNVSGGAESASSAVLKLAESLFTTEIAMAAVAAAAVGLVAAGAGFALAAASEKQSLQLTYGALLQNEEAGVQLQEQIDSLSKTLPISEDAVNAFAVSLVNAGLRGAQLTDTVTSLGTVSAAVGAGGAGKLQNIIERWNAAGKVEPISPKQLAGTGVTLDALNTVIAAKLGTTVENVKSLLKAGKVSTETGIDALNEVIKNKLGDVAAKKLLGFGAQAQLLKKNIGNLFEDALGAGGLESFQKGLADVLSLFSATNGSGKTLKFLLGELFTPIFKGITALLPVVKEVFIQLEIGALRAILGFRTAKIWVEAFFGALADDARTAKIWVDAFLGSIADNAAVRAFADDISFAASAIGVFASVVGSSFSFAYEVIVGFWSGALAIWDEIASFDVFTIGSNLVDGFINGIESRVDGAVASVKGLGDSAIGALKGALGIASPSKEFMKLGAFTAEGFAQGVGANDNAQTSVNNLVQAPAVAQAGRGGGGPVSVSIEMNFAGAVSKADAEEIGNQVLAKVAGYFDSMANQTGAPVTEGAAA